MAWFKDLGLFLTATAFVVSNDALAVVKAVAWVAKAALGNRIQICNGIADDVEGQAALDALPAGGAKLVFLEGGFNFQAQVARAIDAIAVQGAGAPTRITLDGFTPVISAGTQDGWVLKDFDTDAGGYDLSTATHSTAHNVSINGAFATVTGPVPGVTQFPGQEVIRVRELRHPDPAADEPIQLFGRLEHQTEDPVPATPGYIAYLLNRQGRTLQLPTNDLWTDGSGGTGSSTLHPLHAILQTAAAGGDHGLVHCVAAFLQQNGGVWDRIDWDNRLTIAFDIAQVTGDHADLRGRVQIKEVTAEGVLAAEGIGIEVQNLSVHAETHDDVGLENTDTGVTLTLTQPTRVRIEHWPGERVDFFIGNVNVPQVSHVTRVPAGMASATNYFVLSMDNGAVATPSTFHVSPILIWNHL